MASQITIAWGDGTTDKIYVNPGSGSNNDTLSITSDANSTSSARTKTVKVSTVSSGTRPTTRNIIVSQSAGGPPQTYTVKLIPSSYYVSSSYLTVENENNMYTDTSSTNYGTITNTDKSTSYYYFYLRGFNIDSIPLNASIDSFTVRIRGRASGSYNASMYLCHGTTTISGATATALPNSSTVTTRTFNNSSLTWNDIVEYGNTFGIRINGRRNAKNTIAWWRVYGAEIEVTYTL